MTTPEAGTRSSAYVIYEFERRAYLVTEIPVRVGRDSSNDIVLHEAAVSRFNTEIRRENDRSVLSSPGSTPTLLDGVPVAGETGLSQGAKIEIGSAVLTYTEKRLPIGVSVVERARKGDRIQEDVSNRRDTIKHPLMKGVVEEKSDPQLRIKILAAIAAVVLLIYLFGR